MELDEAACTVECAAEGVVPEDFHFEFGPRSSRMIHESSSDAASVKPGIDEESAYFTADQGDEACDTTTGLPDPRLRRRKVPVGNVTALDREELVGQKWMPDGRSLFPDRQDGRKIGCAVLPNHVSRFMSARFQSLASTCLPKLEARLRHGDREGREVS